MAARPYAQMMASVIRSLMRRIDVYDPETGEVRHPLLVPREEKNVLLIVVSGDKGFAGAFNSNIIKAAHAVSLPRKMASGAERRHRNHRPQGARPLPPPLSRAQITNDADGGQDLPQSIGRHVARE